MSESRDQEELVDADLRRAAEFEMKRSLAFPDSNRASKRAKAEGEEDEYLEVGRFDYSSVKDIAAGMTCFLATCDFRREKSCTRELTTFLKPYLLPSTTPVAATSADDNAVGGDNEIIDEPLLSNLKVSCRGLIVLKLKDITPNDGEKETDSILATAKLAQQAVLQIYSNTTAPGASGDASLQHNPQFIQRLVPVLSTCALEEDALKACAARVAGIAALEFEQYKNQVDNGAATMAAQQTHLTFGIHINKRDNGTSTTTDGKETTEKAPLERLQIISAVASGLTSELKNKYNIEAKVDLKAPMVVVDVEVMPIMGKVYAGIAILPQNVCTLKPKLGIKALRQNISLADAGGGKNKKEKKARK